MFHERGSAMTGRKRKQARIACLLSFSAPDGTEGFFRKSERRPEASPERERPKSGKDGKRERKGTPRKKQPVAGVPTPRVRCGMIPPGETAGWRRAAGARTDQTP